jgi:hypothetical protein
MVKETQKNSKHWDVKPSHKAVHTIVTVLATLILVGGGAYAYFFFTKDTETTISNNPIIGETKTIASPAATNLRFDEEAFTFSLPADWKKLGPANTSSYPKYSYQATLKNADNRYLDIYMDKLPLDMAVNKAVAVKAEGAKLSHGSVSDNCANFTARPGGALKVQAKWDGVDFLCDMDSMTRNVTGTSAQGSINKVELISPGMSKHTFFFVYTDNNFSPDYGIFYDFLDSFSVK